MKTCVTNFRYRLNCIVPVVLLLLTAGLLFCSGCVTGETAVREILFEDGDPAIDVVLTPGEWVQLQLEENPSTGYMWSVIPGNDADAHVKLAASEYLPPEISGAAGVPGQRRWLFRAVAPGSARYVFSYQRSWESGNPAAYREVNFLVAAAP